MIREKAPSVEGRAYLIQGANQVLAEVLHSFHGLADDLCVIIASRCEVKTSRPSGKVGRTVPGTLEVLSPAQQSGPVFLCELAPLVHWQSGNRAFT